MTQAELLARLQAQQLRQPKVDSFEQSRLDQQEHARQAKLPKAPIVVAPVKGFTGGILKVDKALKDAGAD